MKIGFFLIDDKEKKVIEDRFSDHEFLIFKGPLNEKNIDEILDFEVIVSRVVGMELELNREVLSKFSELRFISTMSTGFDHIDINYCNEKGIVVSNVLSYAEDSVAELVFGMLLCLGRGIGFTEKNNKSLGIELKGKVLGVIGSGKIGLRVIEIAKGFNMKVLVYDVIFNEEAKERLDFEYVDLDFLIKSSDFISLHAPYNDKTYHILGENLRETKKGSVVINTARGELIDTKVLIELLKGGKIKAGLDVVEEDFREEVSEFDSVFLTNHIGASTKEARDKVLDETIKNIEGFLNRDVRNVVNV